MRESNPEPALGYAQASPSIKVSLIPDGIWQEWDNNKSNMLNYGCVQSFRNTGESHAR